MLDMIKVGVTGVAGRMGSYIGLLVAEAADMELAGTMEAPGHRSVGADAGTLIGAGSLGVAVSDDLEKAFQGAEVIVDFTMPEVTMNVAAYAARAKKAMVIGTTGLSDGNMARLSALAGEIPLVVSPNMSIGVNVMFKVVAELTRLLGEDYDVEIVETHHRLKKDAPSGTALGLARAIAGAKGVDLNEHACYERHGMIGARPKGQIGIQTLRAGDIIGDHTVLFAGNSERIELSHRAHTRQNFAQGAVRAVRWVKGREPGIYSMMDVLGL
jgi:4-hydroxy-tetrahydrodipicolinate reductase